MKRRDLLKMAAKGTAAAIMALVVTRVAGAAPMEHRGRYRLGAASGQSYSARAVELVQRSTVIDMLAPLSLSTPGEQKLLANPDSLKAENYAVYRQSGINVFHETSGYSGPNAHMDVLQFSASLNSFLARHDNWFERIDTPARLDGIKASGKIGILFGVQNSEHFRKLDEVANQVAAPTVSSTPNWHRAKIAHQRVRMEGWRQRRLG